MSLHKSIKNCAFENLYFQAEKCEIYLINTLTDELDSKTDGFLLAKYQKRKNRVKKKKFINCEYLLSPRYYSKRDSFSALDVFFLLNPIK